MPFIFKNIRLYNGVVSSDLAWFKENQSKLRSIDDCLDSRAWCCSDVKKHEFLLEMVTEKEPTARFETFQDIVRLILSLFRETEINPQVFNVNGPVEEHESPALNTQNAKHGEGESQKTAYKTAPSYMASKGKIKNSVNEDRLTYIEKLEKDNRALVRRLKSEERRERRLIEDLFIELAESESVRKSQLNHIKSIEKGYLIEVNIAKDKLCRCDRLNMAGEKRCTCERIKAAREKRSTYDTYEKL